MTVSLLRVSGGDVDPLATKLRAASVLGNVELCPAGIAPSAIVCIRKLRDPLPGGLSLDRQSLYPPPAWQRAVSEAIDNLARRAVRPLREAVPPNTECVVFGDRAEMLACLAIDWRAGAVGLRWWWRSLLPRLDGLPSVLAAWMEAPEYIPAAWQHLAAAGGAVPFARQFTGEQAHAMLKSVAGKFALRHLQDALDAADKRAEPDARNEAIFENQSFAPWQNWSPEGGDASLATGQQFLLGTMLTLQRAPAVARRREFAQATRRWMEVARRDARSVQESASPPPTSFRAIPAISPTESRGEAPARASAKIAFDQVSAEPAKLPMESNLAVSDASKRWEDTAKQVHNRSPRQRERQIENSSGPFEEEETEAIPSRDDVHWLDGAPATELRRSAGAPDRDTSEPTVTAIAAPLPDFDKIEKVEPLFEASASTGYGGLFYLLNFGLYLELYGDITMPSVRDIPLNIWDFLALIGERLVGGELRRDPIWRLLAGLAGREEAREPGRDCVMPDHWRMPVKWLKPFEADGGDHWTAEDGRLRVWRQAKFLILDVPLEPGDPLAQLHHELARPASPSQPDSETPLVAAGGANSLARWLDWLTPYTLVRLQRALGLADMSEIGRAVCQSRARVFVTATHLDVVFSLAELMVEIRLAGLDRDPGWIPAAGRIIRFHFEG